MKQSKTRARWAVCLLLVTVLLLSGCSHGEQGADIGGGGTMNIRSTDAGILRSGTEYRTYQVEEGQRGILSVGITRESGGLDLDIYPADRKEDTAYTGRNLESAEFEVILSEPGEYKVRVTVKSFLGDYGFNWRTEDTSGDSQR